MKYTHAVLAILLNVQAMLCVPLFALESSYVAGDLIGQPGPGGSPWDGDRGWIAVTDGAGVDGKLGIRTAPSEEKVFRKAILKLPEGPADAGSIRISFQMQITSSQEGQAVGVTFGRDVVGPNTGRGLRLIILGDGKVRIVTPDTALTNQYVDESAAFASGWVKVEVDLNFSTHEASLTLDEVPITTQPFLVEGGSRQDSRGVVEISSGGGFGSIVEFDDVKIAEQK